ncbi:MAG: NADH-quinone oxidoreductase subunit J [Deltaproteobacteria bacterium]|nr:NADH-quinone oxidoreductase subunit J [Deltaproteobacteria bacterium]
MELALFVLFGTLAVLGSLGVVLSRNPVRGALWLVGALFCLAVLFILTDAHLLAALEVLVYAGAVMVLFLFVIMLLNLREEELGPRRFTPVKALAVAGTVYLGWLMAVPMWKAGRVPPAAPADYGTVEGVGMLIFKNYLLPFEMTSLLLLAAVVGAVMLAKRRM